MDVRKLSIMCFGLKETIDDDHADNTSNLKHIIYDVLEIPEEDFPFDDIKIRLPVPFAEFRWKILEREKELFISA